MAHQTEQGQTAPRLSDDQAALLWVLYFTVSCDPTKRRFADRCLAHMAALKANYPCLTYTPEEQRSAEMRILLRGRHWDRMVAR